jgi:hypothetical protein
MKSDEISKTIEELDNQKSNLVPRLDNLVEQFRHRLPSIAEPWIKRQLDDTIQRHADRITALGVDKVRALKEKFNRLICQLPEISNEETKNKKDWPHYRTPDSTGYSNGKNEPFFEKSFRSVISYLGSILNEFGLLTEPRGCFPSWQSVAPGKFRYSINFGFEVLSIEPIREYDRLFKEYYTIVEKIDANRKLLTTTKARELWESV